MPNHCHDQGHVDIGISSQLYPTGESLEIYHLTNVKLAGEGGNNKNIKMDDNNSAKWRSNIIIIIVIIIGKGNSKKGLQQQQLWKVSHHHHRCHQQGQQRKINEKITTTNHSGKWGRNTCLQQHLDWEDWTETIHLHHETTKWTGVKQNTWKHWQCMHLHHANMILEKIRLNQNTCIMKDAWWGCNWFTARGYPHKKHI